MVAPSGYTPGARKAAREHGIILTDVEDLCDDIFDEIAERQKSKNRFKLIKNVIVVSFFISCISTYYLIPVIPYHFKLFSSYVFIFCIFLLFYLYLQLVRFRINIYFLFALSCDLYG